MDSEFATRYLKAWNDHDVEAILGFFADDCSYSDVALNESHQGKADVRAFISHMATEFSSDYGFEPGSQVVTDTGYAVEWVMRGTHDGNSAQVQATGKPYAIHGVSVGDIRDGKIARNTDYWSLAEFLGQVGLMPTPGAAAAAT
jgi:steroid delta-isomerase-like uncharacterized protein